MSETGSGCQPDSSGADWFECARGTVGCPRVHDRVQPTCRHCGSSGPAHRDFCLVLSRGVVSGRLRQGVSSVDG